MATDLRAIMDRDERMSKMLRDPDLTDDALLFALATLEFIKCMQQPRHRRGWKKKQDWMLEVSIMAFGESKKDYRVKRVIREDIPRYEASGAACSGCVAPMIRREGLCGKNTYTSWIDRDPLTGDARWVGYCTRHYGHDKDMEHRRRLEEWRANGEPSPPPNRGGVLARHISADWPHLYEWAAPHMTPLEGGKEATQPRPVFELIRGG